MTQRSCLGAYRALACTLLYLGDFEAARQYAIRGLQIWRSGNVQSHAEDLFTPVIGCLCYVGAIRVASRRDRLLPSDHGGSDLTSKGAK